MVTVVFIACQQESDKKTIFFWTIHGDLVENYFYIHKRKWLSRKVLSTWKTEKILHIS